MINGYEGHFAVYPRGSFDIFCGFQYILALYGPVLMKMVTKLKIFWCSSWSWKVFFQEYDPKKHRKTLKAGAKKLDSIAILAILVEKLGHFWSENWLEIHEQIELLLKS